MIVVLKPGEKVEVQFEHSDGSIVVAFNEESIQVKTDWEDSAGRVGTIYEEKFGDSPFYHAVRHPPGYRPV